MKRPVVALLLTVAVVVPREVTTAGAAPTIEDDRKSGKDFAVVNAIRWADADHVIFEAEPEEWTRWYSAPIKAGTSDDAPVMLTPGEGAVELLRAHDVYHELIVFPDDTHEPLLHSRYLYAFSRLEEFIGRFLKRDATRTTAGQ
jgi:hypothetical protein